jgi:hypothetical protein
MSDPLPEAGDDDGSGTRLPLIEFYPGDAAERVAAIRRFFAHTVHYNGYYRGFSDSAEARAAKQARLRDWTLEQDLDAVRGFLADGLDPVTAFLDTWPSLGVLRDASQAERSAWSEQWERVETTLNARLAIACALLSPETLSQMIENLIPELAPVGPLALARVRNEAIQKGSQGFADLILKGPMTVILIELKSRGLTSARKYDAEQLVKYLTLAADEMDSWEHPTERGFAHVLLRPRGGGGMVHRRAQWFGEPETAGGKMRIDSGAVRTLAGSRTERVATDRAMAMIDRMPVYERYYDELAAVLPAEPLPEWDAQVRNQISQICALAEPRGKSAGRAGVRA